MVMVVVMIMMRGAIVEGHLQSATTTALLLTVERQSAADVI